MAVRWGEQVQDRLDWHMRSVAAIGLLLAGCSSINKCDPPVNYTPDPECNQLYDQACGKPDGGAIVCRHQDRGMQCNLAGGYCEPLPIETPCGEPDCDNFMAKHRRDAGSD